MLPISRTAALVASRRHAQIVTAVAMIPTTMIPMASPTRVRKLKRCSRLDKDKALARKRNLPPKAARDNCILYQRQVAYERRRGVNRGWNPSFPARRTLGGSFENV